MPTACNRYCNLESLFARSYAYSFGCKHQKSSLLWNRSSCPSIELPPSHRYTSSQPSDGSHPRCSPQLEAQSAASWKISWSLCCETSSGNLSALAWFAFGISCTHRKDLRLYQSRGLSAHAFQAHLCHFRTNLWRLGQWQKRLSAHRSTWISHPYYELESHGSRGLSSRSNLSTSWGLICLHHFHWSHNIANQGYRAQAPWS